jgi:iron complex outermembrane receptor protein
MIDFMHSLWRQPDSARGDRAAAKEMGETMRSALSTFWLRGSVSTVALGLAVAAIAPSVRAADAAPPAAASAGAPLSELVVTAERRSINLQTAPLAATVISGDLLKNKNIFSVDTLQFTTPALSVVNFGLGYDFNIRGIGKAEGNVQTPSGIVVYRDGVATFPGFFQDEPYYDLANVEVLRGPQGTFAGQNATGGAIFITEADPNFRGYSGSLEAQYGSYEDLRMRGVVNMPVSDTFAIRIAANLERKDSVWHVTGAADDPGHILEADGRLSLLWEPTSAWRISLKDDFHYLETGGIPVSPVPLTGGNYASNANLFDVANNAPLKGFETTNRTVLNIAYTLPDGIVLKSISGYQIGRGDSVTDIDGTAIENAFFAVIGKEHIASEEVNVISPDAGRLRWVLGGYYSNDVVRIPFGLSGFDIHEPPLDILLDYRTPKTTEAAFGQATFDITPALQIVAGARYTHSTFTLDDTTSILFFGLPGADFGLPPETAHLVQPDSKVTGKASLNWKLNDSNFLYALVATGHKPGGINTTPSPFGPGALPVLPFGPEDLIDYEIGWKPTFFDDHLRMQLDGFYTPYRNFQLTYSGAANEGSALIQNVPGTTVIEGLEAEGQGVFGPLSFDFGGAYVHSRLSSRAGTLGGPSGPENIGGAIQPLAPAWTFHVGGQYAIALSGGTSLTPRIDYGYVGSQWASPFQTNEVDAELFHLRAANNLAAQVTWDAGQGFVITAFGTNLLNEQTFAIDVGFTNIPNNPPTVPPTLRYYRVAAAPRQIGIRVSKSF